MTSDRRTKSTKNSARRSLATVAWASGFRRDCRIHAAFESSSPLPLSGSDSELSLPLSDNLNGDELDPSSRASGRPACFARRYAANDRSVSRYLLAKPTGRSQREDQLLTRERSSQNETKRDWLTNL
ncbi:hypothetical protein L596_023832 [Steinernema carpocapsae]|uniref:Uncharacterized protein n=1 Tax=Steinernema carpocapsae TaxID=34508 RepID=A0A4U5MEU9_STECR|nr:hypothetical protein L596_023832 [Steinernema carpocapsae]